MKVTVRSLSGNAEIEIEGDSISAEQLRELAGVASGFTLRQDGRALSNDDEVQAGSYVTATPPEAKHGLRR